MIYYLEELHFSSSWDLSSLYKSSTKETTILSDDGLYKINHNKIKTTPNDIGCNVISKKLLSKSALNSSSNFV